MCQFLLWEWVQIIYLSIIFLTAPPSVESSSCEFAGIDTITDTVGIYLTANISDGAPTVVSCQLNSGQRISKLKLFRSVTTSASPTESTLRTVASVQLNYLPNIVTCTVSNDDGQDTFTCDIQGVYLYTYMCTLSLLLIASTKFSDL